MCHRNKQVPKTEMIVRRTQSEPGPYLIQKAIGVLDGRPYGLDAAMCCCPGHADKIPSLRLWIKPDGRIENFCFAGCNFQVIDALLIATGIQQPYEPGYEESAWDKREREEIQAEAHALRAKEQAEKDLAGTKKALSIWSEAKPIQGTLGELYRFSQIYRSKAQRSQADTDQRCRTIGQASIIRCHN